MKRAAAVCAPGLLWAVAATADPPPNAPCPPGDVLHWVADYCMAELQTDDEIAASACIARESGATFPGRCAGTRHFKRRYCAALIATGARSGSVEACLEQADVVGPTVENGGVGGAGNSAPDPRPRPDAAPGP